MLPNSDLVKNLSVNFLKLRYESAKGMAKCMDKIKSISISEYYLDKARVLRKKDMH